MATRTRARSGYVTREEAAELFGIHINTVGRWLRSGAMYGERTGKGWSYLIPMSEIERIQRDWVAFPLGSDLEDADDAR
jgi:excisionase family DNA binding protein